MSVVLYAPLNKSQLKLCIPAGAERYRENEHSLRHRSEHTHASTIHFQVDLVTKAWYAINLKLHPTLLDAENLILLTNLAKP